MANYQQVEAKLLKQPFNLRFALHVLLYWIYTAVWSILVRMMFTLPSAGKDSQLFYVVLVAFLGVTWAMFRAVLIVVRPRFYELASTGIPLWEQVLLAFNEVIALSLTAYVWGTIFVRLFQPAVFTTRFNPLYSIGLTGAVLLYYVGTQLMWLEHLNNLLSRNSIWLLLARIFSPFLLFVATMLIASRFTERIDPRTASLLDNADVDLAILALVPVIWLMILVVLWLVFTSERGMRQRFLPEALLERLPQQVQALFRAISDMDLLLMLALLTTFIPMNLLLLGENQGFVASARQSILQRGSALIETSEQALALLFVLPFYVFIMFILVVYALVISRPSLSAENRDTLMRSLPVGFLITMIITLYLFAVPFTQVFTESRLPTFSRDLGRILAFYLLLPVILLYLHYLFLVRFPYGRGQRLWREQYAVKLDQDLSQIDRRIRNLNQELSRMDNRWQLSGRADEISALKGQLDTLHRYIHLNGERDDLNMQRLQIVSARQNLAEISETPYSVAVARLPLRVISIGLPLILAFQLYQWAVLNEGLREVVNNPDLTVLDFIQILLDNIEF